MNIAEYTVRSNSFPLYKAGKAAKENMANHAVYEIKHYKLVYRRLILTYFNKSSQAQFSRSYSEKDIYSAPNDWFVPKPRNNRVNVVGSS